MDMRQLLVDVSLVDIRFTLESVVFEFLDMYAGARVATLTCENVCAFSYSEPDGGGLPYYVGELNLRSVTREEAVALVGKMGFGWRDTSGILPDQTFLEHVEIDGGVVVSVVCRRSTLTGA